jgi:hypothetical protein
MTLGYRVADFSLFKLGFINEMKMAMATYTTGVAFGFLMGDVGSTYKWPNRYSAPCYMIVLMCTHTQTNMFMYVIPMMLATVQ